MVELALGTTHKLGLNSLDPSLKDGDVFLLVAWISERQHSQILPPFFSASLIITLKPNTVVSHLASLVFVTAEWCVISCSKGCVCERIGEINLLSLLLAQSSVFMFIAFSFLYVLVTALLL